jgi:hypothetical protein
MQTVSHGICRDCLRDELTKLRPTVSPALRQPLSASALG